MKERNNNELSKINFFDIFIKPFNWTTKNKKIAEIDYPKEESRRSFTNNILESFLYLNTLYEKISFDKKDIDIFDFVISSIIFTSLIEKIREIDVKLSGNILKECNFSKIINTDFGLPQEQELSYSINLSKNNINKIFVEKYIGKTNEKNNEKNYELQFLKGIRNKLVHPNGSIYNKTHMYWIGTHKEDKSPWFVFGECYFVESKENRSPTFFINKSIFIDAIKEISKIFSKNISRLFVSYINNNSKKNKPSLKLCSIKEAYQNYSKYFEDSEEIFLLFLWSKERLKFKSLIEYLELVYTIAKFMKKSNNLHCDWRGWILPNIDEDIKNLMKDCGHQNSDQIYLISKMTSEYFPEKEWLRYFGNEPSIAFLKKYKNSKIKSYNPRNIREKFLLVIFNEKSEEYFLLLLQNLKNKYENIKTNH